VYKAHYRRFLEKHSGELHFTAHSHHFWPDVTFEAMVQCWEDAARYVDDKWDFLYREVIPETQALIAAALGSASPGQIVFAPNTHEFVSRVLSCFDPGRPLAVLTTDSEFHSFRRQIDRLSEYPWVSIEKVPVDPIAGFEGRFLEAAEKRPFDLVFLSQVFYNSGFALRDPAVFMAALRQRTPEEALIVLDGYHGFCALPTNIGPFADRVFYLAGGYKYAQAGEGVCFLHVPSGCRSRPANTGWFAEWVRLSGTSGGLVEYPGDGRRFAGATFDPGGIYRLRAVLRLFRTLGLNIHAIHAHVAALQGRFRERLKSIGHPVLGTERLLFDERRPHGHFLCFELPSTAAAQTLTQDLRAQRIFVDQRGHRVRFGFGLYHDDSDIDEALQRLGGK
jgi:selenocysteine lyase/cysteine desulfurase